MYKVISHANAPITFNCKGGRVTFNIGENLNIEDDVINSLRKKRGDKNSPFSFSEDNGTFSVVEVKEAKPEKKKEAPKKTVTPKTGV